MNDITLVDITPDNWEAVCCLDPGKEGRAFVASNSFSIAQSVYEKGWIVKGIAADGTLVGFTMYGETDEFGGIKYEICRFMIDRRYQGMGYGKRALRVIVDEMARRYGCDEIYLSTAPDNARGQHVYMSMGFRPTGQTCGEGEDLEDVYRLDLPKGGEPGTR